MTVHRFRTVLGAEGSGVFIEVPLDVPALFGRARPAVRGTIDGHPFRSTVAVYGGRYYLGVKRALREAAGVAAGDAVVVELEADEEPRTVEPPADLAAALAGDPAARAPSPASPTPTSGSTPSGWRRQSARRPAAAASSRPWPCSATAGATPEGQPGAEPSRAWRDRASTTGAALASAQAVSAVTGPRRLCPSGVREYSTLGGTSGKTRRSTNPLRSSSRSVWVSAFLEMPPICVRSLEWRLGPSTRLLATSTAQVWAIRSRAVRDGQSALKTSAEPGSERPDSGDMPEAYRETPGLLNLP
jgi:hypothetical protein